MEVGTKVVTVHAIRFYPRINKPLWDVSLAGKPSPSCVGTLCRVVREGIRGREDLVQSCDVKDGYFALVRPCDVKVV